MDNVFFLSSHGSHSSIFWMKGSRSLPRTNQLLLKNPPRLLTFSRGNKTVSSHSTFHLQAPKMSCCFPNSQFTFPSCTKHMLNLKKAIYVHFSPDSTSLTHGAEPFLRSCQLCSHSRISQQFMEPKGSLPCSQELSAGPYTEPDKSNPYHHIVSIQDPF
jgi:hypothetical protein